MGLGVRALGVAAAVCAAFSPLALYAQDRSGETRTLTTIVGGPGGGAFAAPCPAGTFLTGIQARQGEWIDQISAICSRWNPQTQAMEQAFVSRPFGGSGGSPAEMRCAGRGVIATLQGRQADNRDRTVNYLSFSCVDPLQPSRTVSKVGLNTFGDQSVDYSFGDYAGCGPDRIAAGIHGRAGAFLDAVGLICTEKLASPPAPPPITPPNQTVLTDGIVKALAGLAVNQPPACKGGFVWREAGPNDFACVPPASRERARQDNAAAAGRVNPQGPYGPQSCVSGFVWREAFPGDLVCVTPATRDETFQENEAALARTL